jgi:hypothetical protein
VIVRSLECRHIARQKQRHLFAAFTKPLRKPLPLLLTGWPWPGMTIVFSVTAATFAWAALIIPPMFPPVDPGLKRLMSFSTDIHVAVIP